MKPEELKINRDPNVGRAPEIPRDTLATSGRLAAPKGKFRLVVADTFDYSDYSIDFESREDAVRVAEAKAGVMRVAYVYDPDGKVIFKAGQP